MLANAFLLSCFIVLSFSYRVQFDVTVPSGDKSFVVNVNPTWAPLASTKFKELLGVKYYDENAFFRVSKNFMTLFGISGNPEANRQYTHAKFEDEPAKVSNKRGYLTFIPTGGVNSRATQIMINNVDNARLDAHGYVPFGFIEGDGMNIVAEIFDCGEGPASSLIYSQGNEYLNKNFPQLSYIKKVFIIEDDKPVLALGGPTIGDEGHQDL